jgi:hypothetical protein
MEAESRQQLVDQGKELKEKLAELEVELDSLEAALQLEGQKLPNFSHPDVSPPPPPLSGIVHPAILYCASFFSFKDSPLLKTKEQVKLLPYAWHFTRVANLSYSGQINFKGWRWGSSYCWVSVYAWVGGGGVVVRLGWRGGGGSPSTAWQSPSQVLANK